MKAIRLIAAAAMAACALCSYAQEQTGTLALGDYDSPKDYYDGTTWEAAPANFFYVYSSSQIVYTAAELAPIADVNGQITKVTFKYVEGTPAYQSGIDLTMDISLDDATDDAFIKDAAGLYSWMPFTDTCKGSWSLDDFENYYDAQVTEIEITLDTPYQVKPGTPLVITTTATASEALGYISAFSSYCYAGAGRPKRSASKCSDTQEVIPVPGKYIDSIFGEYSGGEFADVPVVKFDYTYGTDGITDMTVDAPAEAAYYNLQGIRIAQPTPGAVYLKVQGTKATKVTL